MQVDTKSPLASPAFIAIINGVTKPTIDIGYEIK